MRNFDAKNYPPSVASKKIIEIRGSKKVNSLM